jgi:hypothetical protein
MRVDKMTDQARQQNGEIVRVADDSIAYVYVREANRTLSFVPSAIENYRGESFAELGLTVGIVVGFEVHPKSDAIDHVRIPVRSTDKVLVTRGDIDVTLPNRDFPAGNSSSQLILRPDRQPIKGVPITRALPLETRKFGKLVNTSVLAPGDLLLTSDLKPDNISRLIVEVQQKGGTTPMTPCGHTPQCMSVMVRASMRRRSTA